MAVNDDCLFCKIIAGDIPADIVYESDTVLGFRDVNPVAPTHVLFVPKKHISTINDLAPADAALIGDLYLAAKTVASETGIAETGFRAVMNCGDDGGQSVFHIHLHLLGGRSLAWPPG